ncbi:aminoglycoside phosphotransferase [Bryobacterales bacterium F-183]|nr:aminoglycoside phosphotransferase [Bryobacterales bacterium F-183]
MTSSDSAPIRPGEELDLQALQQYLGTPLASISQFPGGHSNLTYLLTFTDGQQAVLRRAPLGPVAPKAHDMVREARILEAVSPLFPAAPKPLRICEDPAILGVPFFLMERRQGRILRTEVPADIAAQPDYAERISAAFVACLADLHRIDLAANGLLKLGKPEGFVQRQVKGWTDRWNLARTDDTPPDTDHVTAWLAANIPNSTAATLVHNDFKLDNVMLPADSIDRVEAVLDWEMATIGDPMIDLGLTLCYWCHSSFSTFTAGPGWYTRDQFLHHYARLSGHEVQDIRFHETLGVFKLAVILQQIYFRYRRGQTSDPRFAEFGHRVRSLTSKALELCR